METKTQGVYVTSLKSQVFEHIPDAPHHDSAEHAIMSCQPVEPPVKRPVGAWPVGTWLTNCS